MIDQLGLSADTEDFSYLEEEIRTCQAAYLKKNGTLIDIDLI
jgi:hypothetical protein